MVVKSPDKILAARLINNRIHLKFPFDRELVEKIKTLNGRKFDLTKKEWTVPLSNYNVYRIRKMGFYANKELLQWWKEQNPDLAFKLDFKSLPHKLMAFQEEGVKFIEERDGRALLADEMGLGKTVQVAAWIKLSKGSKPVLIICPSSVKSHWRNEISKWAKIPKEDINILRGRTPIAHLLDPVIIINYDILSYWEELLSKKIFRTIILDEFHYIKNSKAKRTKAARGITRKAANIILLSGTPIINKPIEFFNGLHMLDPANFNSFWDFATRYCGAKSNGFGWDFSGSSNRQELHEILTSTVMIRRKKKDVLDQLPDVTTTAIPMEIKNYKEYKKLEGAFIELIKQFEGKIPSDSGTAFEMKKMLAQSKIESIVEWVRDFLESDRKLVIFTHHHFVSDRLVEEFRAESILIDGRTPVNRRERLVRLFAEDPKRQLCVAGIKAIGTGTDGLQRACSDMAVAELPWAPGELAQIIGRIDRMGQESDKINIYHLLAENTIEEQLIQVVDAKMKNLSEILDGEKIEDEDLLISLLDKIRRPRE